MDLLDIETRIKNGYAVNDAEKAFLLRHNPYALAAFMIENNPGSLNLRLKTRWGYTHLGFEPDVKKLARQLEILIQTKESEVFGDLVKNFNLIPTGLSPQFIQELTNQFNQ